MSRRPKASAADIWIGDVLRAWRALGAFTPAERQRVAAALGFEYVPQQPAPVSTRATPPPRIDRPPGAEYLSPLRAEAPGTVEPRPEQAAPVAADEPSLLFALEPIQAAASSPAWAAVTDVVPSDEVRHLRHQPALEPLFTPGWTRAALGALSATRVEEGPIDVERITDAICRTRPLTTLPREPVRTLRRGVQLLVDEDDGFSFHQRDVDAVTEAMAAVAGRDRTEVLRFARVPSEGVRRARFEPATPWRPPAPGTPIVVISSFGLVRGSRTRPASSPADWERVARTARTAGCTLLGLVPLAPGRWPLRLRQAVRLLRWDRRATAALAQRVARGELG